jgi:sigma-B regulation protein RsbU (phosphoserine phosphatase)
MVSIEHGFLQAQLEERRHRLQHALERAPKEAALTKLLADVDAALKRMTDGTYGICETCHEPVEKERLLADPLVCYCLDHLPAAQKRALELDLELATRVQRGLLPPQDLAWGGWEVRHHYAPASAVSGDYCDVIRPDNGRGELFFVVGDVSGKGVAASMLMTQLHAMFRSLSSAGLPLDQIVSVTNRVFCESALAGQYATLVCGRAAATGEVEISNSGHLPALVVRQDSIEKLESAGVPLGMFCAVQPSFRKIHLGPGESLVLYTDGLSEARNGAQEEYGVERYVRLLGGKCCGKSARDLVETSLRDLGAFTGGGRLGDDLTLMVLRRS